MMPCDDSDDNDDNYADGDEKSSLSCQVNPSAKPLPLHEGQRHIRPASYHYSKQLSALVGQVWQTQLAS
jgi:hypothetical protein